MLLMSSFYSEHVVMSVRNNVCCGSKYMKKSLKMNKALKQDYRRKYVSVQVLEYIYGLSRPCIVAILRDFPQIDYVEITRPNKRYGRRLVNLESFNAWFDTNKRSGSKRLEEIAA